MTVKLRSRLVSAALLVGLMLVASPVAIASAHGGPPPQNVVPNVDLSSCTGAPSDANCDGIDPTFVWSDGRNCASSASTMWTQNFWDYSAQWQVQMRYSSLCKSRWTRLVCISGCGPYLHGVMYTWSRNYQVTNGPYNMYSGAYSDMVYAPADTTDNHWQVLSEFYDSSCGAYGIAEYYPSNNSFGYCA
jgi:uncharacterized protein DUF2690